MAPPVMSSSPCTARRERSCSREKKLTWSNTTAHNTPAMRMLAMLHSPPPPPPRPLARRTATTGGLRCAITPTCVCLCLCLLFQALAASEGGGALLVGWSARDTKCLLSTLRVLCEQFLQAIYSCSVPVVYGWCLSGPVRGRLARTSSSKSDKLYYNGLLTSLLAPKRIAPWGIAREKIKREAIPQSYKYSVS